MYRLVTIILLLLVPSILQAQNAELRQARIYAGDIAELTITHDASIPSMYAVDTTLLESDFEVLSSDSRVYRVQQDGQSLHRMQWSIRLLPRRSGTLDIPQLKFGDNYSDALQLSVIPVPADLSTAQIVFVEIAASPHSPYPGQQTRIVTRLFHNLAFDDGILYEPESRQSKAFRSGRDTHYEIRRDGHLFTVLERSILLIPQSVDELHIQAASFNGSFPSANPLDTLDGGVRYIHRKSKALNLPLRNLPGAIDAAGWLPAQQLELSLEWENSSATLKPGDSLGLVLNLRATGLPAEALPANLLLGDSDQFKIYADQESRSTQVTGAPGEEQLIGHLRQRYAIVLEQAGEVILPAVMLNWWDVVQDRARVARLDAVTLKVSAPASSADRLGVSDIVLAGNSTMAAGLMPLRLQPVLPWMLIALTALCLIGLAWVTRVRWLVIVDSIAEMRRCSRYRQTLERACRSNDAVAARKCLIEWSRVYWSDQQISSLYQIIARCSPAWADELARLDAALFAAHQPAWQGDRLQRLVRQLPRSPASRHRRQALNELPGPYPHTGSIHQATTKLRPV